MAHQTVAAPNELVGPERRERVNCEFRIADCEFEFAPPGQLDRYAPHVINRLALLIALSLSFSTALAQSKRMGTFRFHASKSGHSASVIFRVRPFTSDKPIYNPNIGVMVNGRKAHGAESTPEARNLLDSPYFPSS